MASIDSPSAEDVLDTANQGRPPDQHAGESARPRRKLKREREVDSESDPDTMGRKPTVNKQRSRSKRAKHAGSKHSSKR